ncbi:TIGR02444 family protein [Alphaproteobacteria bacterium HT1-32]|nr:TIGR02444 family protein [Alphaproteobacteria bacterium HT1-32]
MDNPFWDFSLRVYGQAEVPAACLRIQAAFGADVNILLYLCWLAARGIAVSDTDIEAVVTASGRWHREVVIPLRQIRTKLKSDSLGAEATEAESFRSSVKRLELTAEQHEQDLLYGLEFSYRPVSLAAADRSVAMRRALEAYLATLSGGPPDDQSLGTLVDAALY